MGGIKSSLPISKAAGQQDNVLLPWLARGAHSSQSRGLEGEECDLNPGLGLDTAKYHSGSTAFRQAELSAERCRSLIEFCFISDLAHALFHPAFSAAELY